MLRGGLLASVLAAVLLLACSDGGSTSSSSGTSSSQGGSGGGGGQGGTGGGSGGAGGQGGDGGQGGSMMSHGPAAQDIVSSGEVSKSPSYKLVWTLGQSTQNQSKMSSAGYRLQGGLVGANGSVP